MATPKGIAASRLVTYLRTPGFERADLVRRQAMEDAQPYDPARNPYPPMIAAIAFGRRTGQDSDVIWNFVTSASRTRRPIYEKVAEGWMQYLPALADTTVLRAKRGEWMSPASMAVRVKPDLVVQHRDGRIELLRLYMKTEPLDRHTATAMWWLLNQVADELYSNATAVVVDVRRGRTINPLPRTPDYDAWMQSEALSYAHMRSIIDAA